MYRIIKKWIIYVNSLYGYLGDEMKDKVYLKIIKKIYDIRNNCMDIFFIIECDNGMYGINCSSNCGYCY